MASILTYPKYNLDFSSLLSLSTLCSGAIVHLRAELKSRQSCLTFSSSAGKCTGCSSRRPRFNSQHPHSSSHLPVTPAPVLLTTSHRHTRGQNSNEHKRKINCIFKREETPEFSPPFKVEQGNSKKETKCKPGRGSSVEPSMTLGFPVLLKINVCHLSHPVDGILLL